MPRRDARPSTTQIAYMRHVDDVLQQRPASALTEESPDLSTWEKRAPEMRSALRGLLGLPQSASQPERPPVSYTCRGVVKGDGYEIQKLVYESEASPLSQVPALLYKPVPAPTGPAPAIVRACGHGGSKSTFYDQYSCQLYAKLGCYVLMPEPIGEEERHPEGILGPRGHREERFLDRANAAGRPVVGKMVYDLIRGIDLLASLPEVDAKRIGCAGSSLGGTLTQYLTAVEPRVRLCLNSAWTADYRLLDGTRGCCWRVFDLLTVANQSELIALGAPHCAYLVLCGGRDPSCPPLGTEAIVKAARGVYELYGAEERCRLELDAEGGHRPYHIAPVAVDWLVTHFDLESSRTEKVLASPNVQLHEVAKRFDIPVVKKGRTREIVLSPLHADAWTLDVGVTIHSPEKLRVLEEGERVSGAYLLERWIEGVEAKLPSLPDLAAVPQEREAVANWLRERSRLQTELKEVLGKGMPGIAWSSGGRSVKPGAGAVERDAGGDESPFVGVKESVSVYCHDLGVDGMYAYRLVPTGIQSGRVVVYLPGGYQARTAGLQKLDSWLRQGDHVVVLEAAHLYDNAVLVGMNETAVNVAMVRAAVDGTVGRDGIETVSCHSEVDDVALWTALTDERIDGVEIASRAGREASVLGNGRYEGLVPRWRQITDYLGLCALVHPRRVTFCNGVLTDEEQRRWEAWERAV